MACLATMRQLFTNLAAYNRRDTVIFPCCCCHDSDKKKKREGQYVKDFVAMILVCLRNTNIVCCWLSIKESAYSYSLQCMAKHILLRIIIVSTWLKKCFGPPTSGFNYTVVIALASSQHSFTLFPYTIYTGTCIIVISLDGDATASKMIML